MKKNLKNTSICMISLPLLYTTQAFSAETEDLHSLGVIDVTATADSKKLDKSKVEDTYYSPLTSTFLGKTEVDRFKGTRNSDIFNQITGVQINNPANEAGALDIGIRGMQGNGRVPIVIDDAVQSTMTERGYQGSSDRTYIDMDLIRSVQVDKGPAIGADTAGATGGRVEMRTINADDIIPDKESFGINLNIGTYNNNKKPNRFGDAREQLQYPLKRHQSATDFRNGFYTVAMAGRNDRGSLLMAYTERDTGNYFAGKRNARRYDSGTKFDQVTRPGQEVANTSNYNSSFLAKATLNADENNSLLVTYRHHKQKAGEILSAYLTKEKNEAGDDIQAQWSLGTAELDAVSVSHRFNPIENPWFDLKSVLFYTELKTEQHNGFNGRGQYGDQYWNSLRDRRLGLNVTNTSLLPAVPVMGDMQLSYGASLEKQLIDPRVTRRSSGSSNPDGNRKSSSLFANISAEPFSWVTASAGIRKTVVNLHSNQQIEYKKDIFDNPENRGGGWRSYLNQYGLPTYCPTFVNGKYFIADANNPDDVKKHCLYTRQEIVTGQSKKDFRYALRPDFTASLTFHITPELDVFTSYANVNRAPSAYEQISQGSTMSSASYMGQSVVNSENTQNIEAGLAARYQDAITSGDKFNFRISKFYNKNKNYIAPAARWDGLYAFVNYDSFSTQGTEVQIDYDTGKFYTSAGLTRFDKQTVCSKLMAGNASECNSVGFSMGGISTRLQPKDNLVVTAGYRFLEDNSLDLGMRYRYHSRKQNPENWLSGTAAQQIMEHADANQFIDIYASYKVNNNLTVQAGIDNLTDQYAIAPGAAVWIPEPGRTWRLTINTKF